MVLFSYELKYLDRLVDRHETQTADFTSIVKLRFKIDYNLPIESRIDFSFSSIPFKNIADDYIIGSHIDSLFFVYKRSRHQIKINRFDLKFILKLSRTPYTFEPRLINEFKALKQVISPSYDLMHKFRDISNELIGLQKSVPSSLSNIKDSLPLLKTISNLSLAENDRLRSGFSSSDIAAASKFIEEFSYLDPNVNTTNFDLSSLTTFEIKKRIV
jgi:hypothetical protein